MSYDPVNRIVRQYNGRTVYRNEFGGYSTIEPNHNKQEMNDQARREINQTDKKIFYNPRYAMQLQREGEHRFG